MSRVTTLLPLSLFICLVTLSFKTQSFSDQNGVTPSFESPFLVKKDQRTRIIATEFGEISAVQIGDGYHLQFITLEPNSLLLPVLLHSDMVFFVHTGSGILNWIDDEKEKTLELRRGDVYRLRSGTVFYLHSNEVPEKLRVYAIFDVEKCLYDPCLGAYSSIRDLLLGFDDRTLQAAFAVPKDVLGRLRHATKPPLIINAQPRSRTQEPEEDKWQSRLVRLFVRDDDVIDHLAMRPVDSNKKKTKTYNVFEEDPDFENDYGRSIVVDKKALHALKDSRFGVFMVNLTKGSMMGPHWNPRASEISIVLRGEGMIRVVSQQSLSSCKKKSERFLVEEGDVFVVPKFHPMAQMSFENSSFVFMGFSTSVKKNHPQFLVGQSSVLKVLDPEILAVSFNLSNETVKRLLEAQEESLMFECVSCAEEEFAKLIKEIEERRRREEEAKRPEEEKKRREEEEIERIRREIEEARRREEERKREEEAAKRQEKERKKREEEAEEARKREEERHREEEEAKRREEERRKREEEAEEARKREEERQREEEEAKRQEEERRKREEEAEEARKREEEREKEEEIAKKREEERQREEIEEIERKRREEAAARKREEKRKREEEMARKREEERQRREEEARKREEEIKREEEMAKKQEEERQKKEREEMERKRREEAAMRKREEEIKREEEMAKKREEERQRKEREEMEKKRREEEAMRKREEEGKREEEAAEKAEEERKKREEEEKQRPPPQPQPAFIASAVNVANES